MTMEDTKNEEKTPRSNQEASLRACLTVAGSFSAIFASVGFLNAYGVFQDYYHRNQLSHKSEFTISWIGSFVSFSVFIFAAPAGALTDKYGPRPLLLGGGIGTILAVFMVSLCKEYYQFFLAHGFLLGASMSFLTLPAFATVTQYFKRHRGLAIGITVSGSSLGGIVWPIMLDRLLNKHKVSFGWTMRIVAFTMIPLVIFAILTVRRPIQLPAATTTTNPSNSSSAETALEHGDEQDSATLSSKPTGSPKKKMDFSLIKNPTFIIFCLGVAVFNLAMFSPLFFVTSYAINLGMSTSLAVNFVSLLNAASLFGRILPGIVSDIYGHFNLLCIAALLSAVICFCWTTAESVGGIVVWALAYGFTSGAILSVQSACATQLASEESHGAAMGLVLGFAAITGLFGSPISAELIPHGYLALSMYAGSALLVGALLIVYARLRQSTRLFVKI